MKYEVGSKKYDKTFHIHFFHISYLILATSTCNI